MILVNSRACNFCARITAVSRILIKKISPPFGHVLMHFASRRALRFEPPSFIALNDSPTIVVFDRERKSKKERKKKRFLKKIETIQDIIYRIETEKCSRRFSIAASPSPFVVHRPSNYRFRVQSRDFPTFQATDLSKGIWKLPRYPEISFSSLIVSPLRNYREREERMIARRRWERKLMRIDF